MELVLLWIMWCFRNKYIFDNTKHTVFDLCTQLSALYTHIVEAYGAANIHNMPTIERHISWTAPRSGFIAINVDGSVFTDS